MVNNELDKAISELQLIKIEEKGKETIIETLFFSNEATL